MEISMQAQKISNAILFLHFFFILDFESKFNSIKLIFTHIIKPIFNLIIMKKKEKKLNNY